MLLKLGLWGPDQQEIYITSTKINLTFHCVEADINYLVNYMLYAAWKNQCCKSSMQDSIQLNTFKVLDSLTEGKTLSELPLLHFGVAVLQFFLFFLYFQNAK